MEFKKKTIIWEDNNEPPKDYIWIKSDGKAYEFDYNDRKWKESTSINVNNNGSDDDSGGSTEIDYEAIYQFYKNKVVESIPEEHLGEVIIPEHFIDIEEGAGISEEYKNKTGIWYSDTRNYNLAENDIELFCEMNTTPFIRVEKRIYYGTYKFIQM